MDCDGGSDSGNWGAVGINGTRPMDSHLYQKDGKPSSPEAKELSGTQEHPVWLVRPAWLGSPPLFTLPPLGRHPPLYTENLSRQGKVSGPMSVSRNARQRGSPIGRRPAPTVGWPSLRRVAPLWGKAVGKVV